MMAMVNLTALNKKEIAIRIFSEDFYRLEMKANLVSITLRDKDPLAVEKKKS